MNESIEATFTIWPWPRSIIFRQQRPRQRDDCANVERHFVEVTLRGVREQRSERPEAGIVDENPDAPDPCRRCDDGLDAVRSGQVGDDNLGTATTVLYLSG
jgi:hypothetical protein